MSTIRMPPEFKKICRNLGQNIGYEQPDLNTMVLYALSGLDLHDASVIRSFLDTELLSGRYDLDSLQQFWFSTPASIYFHDGQGLVEFLKLLRAALGQPPYAR